MLNRSVKNRTAISARQAAVLALMLALIASGSARAQPPVESTPPENSETSGPAEQGTQNVREKRIARYLTGATFTGAFTMGEQKDVAPKAESYTITSCEPLAEENRYRLKVKIRYGDVDGEFPMDLDILWAGMTPVITLDALAIPGLGTFSARVLFHRGRYAGTWQHGEKGGHLFGKVTPAAK